MTANARLQQALKRLLKAGSDFTAPCGPTRHEARRFTHFMEHQRPTRHDGNLQALWMHHQRTFRAVVLLLAAIFILMDAASAQRRGKRRKLKRQPAATRVVVSSFEPQVGSAFYRFMRTLPAATRVEVSQLRLAMDRQALGNEVWLYGKLCVRVFATETLLDNEAEGFAQRRRGQKRGTGDACCAPAHLLRFYPGDRLLLETVARTKTISPTNHSSGRQGSTVTRSPSLTLPFME